MSCIELIHLYENRVREQDELIVEILENNDMMALYALCGFSFMLLVSLSPVIYNFIKSLLKRF